jgi:putative ABC transport system permease protein
MTTLLQNFRFALRLLWKSPGFTAVAVITLALGIGANTAIFSVVYSTLLEPMPYPNPSQLVMVWSKVNGGNNVVSSGDFLDWKRQNSTFQSMGAWTGSTFNLATGEQPQDVSGQLTTPGFYSMMGVKFSLGRDFIPEEGEYGKDQEVILVNRLWQRLGADPNIIGKQLRVDGKPYTVVGVMAPGAPDRLQTEMIAPLAFKPEQINHGAHWMLVMGRLKPGVTLAAAQADMAVVTSRIAKDNPQTNKGWGASVELLHNDFFPKDTQRTLWFLLGAVGFVLLIACANVANLLLAKATTRFKEVAVRSSLGATRSRVFSQFLTESIALALIGGVVGIGLSVAMLKALMILMPPYTLPSEADVRLSVPVLLFTFLATLVAGVLFGCAPAWKASAVNLNETLKEGGRSGTGRGRNNLRRGLVIAEFGLALTLLAGAGLAIHSFWNLTRVDLGTRTDHILTYELHIQPQHFTGPQQIVTFYRQLLDKLLALPGVSNAEIGTGTPLEGTYFGMDFDIVGQPKLEAGSRHGAGFQMVTPDYFKTFGIQLLKGRGFTEQDIDGSPRVAMVNEDFVRRYFPGVDPIGQRLTIEQLIPAGSKLGSAVDWEIVGVFHTVRSGGFKNDNFPEIDVPFYQSPWPTVNGAVRTSGDPETITKSVAAVVASMDPDIALAYVKTMDQVLDANLLGDRFITVLYLTFAVVALLLAAVGIYGVMAFSVAQRTHEIGLRMALGADRNQVLGLVLKEGIVLAAIGLGLGLGGAYFVGRAIRGTLYGVGSVDFTAFSLVSVLLLMSALLACYFPAQRATKVDPMVALRYE